MESAGQIVWSASDNYDPQTTVEVLVGPDEVIIYFQDDETGEAVVISEQDLRRLYRELHKRFGASLPGKPVIRLAKVGDGEGP